MVRSQLVRCMMVSIRVDLFWLQVTFLWCDTYLVPGCIHQICSFSNYLYKYLHVSSGMNLLCWSLLMKSLGTQNIWELLLISHVEAMSLFSVLFYLCFMFFLPLLSLRALQAKAACRAVTVIPGKMWVVQVWSHKTQQSTFTPNLQVTFYPCCFLFRVLKESRGWWVNLGCLVPR